MRPESPNGPYQVWRLESLNHTVLIYEGTSFHVALIVAAWDADAHPEAYITIEWWSPNNLDGTPMTVYDSIGLLAPRTTRRALSALLWRERREG